MTWLEKPFWKIIQANSKEVFRPCDLAEESVNQTTLTSIQPLALYTVFMKCVSGRALSGNSICHHDVLLGWNSTLYHVPGDDQQDNRQVGAGQVRCQAHLSYSALQNACSKLQKTNSILPAWARLLKLCIGELEYNRNTFQNRFLKNLRPYKHRSFYLTVF